MQVSPEVVYDRLQLLEQVDPVSSAECRELAQEALADPEVSFDWQVAIADRLNHANQALGQQTVGDNDSY